MARQSTLYQAAEDGDLERVNSLLAEGADKDETFGSYRITPLLAASCNGHLPIVQLLVEQGAVMEKTDKDGRSPFYVACREGQLQIARYLLEQGADRDKACFHSQCHFTPLHVACNHDRLEITKLLMVYGADLNARDNRGRLPIELTYNEAIKQAIRDEPRRRMDHGHKRATEQDRHPIEATSASAQHEEAEEDPISKRPRLEGGEEVEGKVAEEDEDSEPSDGEED